MAISVDDKTTAGLARIGAHFKAWGAGISTAGLGLVALGAAITVPLIAAAKASAESGAALYDMSQRTGISVERLSSLGYAADQSGSSLEAVEGSIRKMSKSLAGTDDVIEGTSNAMKELGIASEDLKGLSPEKQFDLVAQKIRGIKDPSEQATKAMRVFGRSGTTMLPLIRNMEKFEARAKAFGFIRSTESAKAGKAFIETLYDADRAAKSLWGALASGLFPLLQHKAESLTKVTLIAREWIKANKGLVAIVFEAAFVIGLAGTALIVLGAVLSGIGSVIGAVVGTWGALVAILGAASSPVTIIAAGLVGLVGTLLLATDTGLEFFDSFMRGFEQLEKEALSSFHGIVDAIAGGDMKLAMQIAVTFLKLEWERGIAFLNKAWLGFKREVLTVAYGAFYGVQSTAGEAMHGIEIAWIETVAVFKQVWAEFGTFFKLIWNDATSLVDKSIVYMLQKLGKLSPEAAANAAAAVDQASKGNEGAILDDRQKQINQIEKDRSSSRDSEGKQHAAAMATIGKGFNDATGEVDRQLAEDLAGSTSQIESLKQQLAAMRGQASKERAALEAKATQDQDKAQAGGDAAGKKSSSVGSFNAAASFGLGGNTITHRIAKATEETAKNTRRAAAGTGLAII